MPSNHWAKLGSVVLFIGALGHFILVDLSAIMFNASYVSTVPNNLMNELTQTEINWGYLGKTNAYRMLSGFSLWAAAGCFVVGTFNWIIFSNLPAGHALRKQSLWLSLAFSGIFLLLAIAHFIYPATVGGILALLFFVLAVLRERKQPL